MSPWLIVTISLLFTVLAVLGVAPKDAFKSQKQRERESKKERGRLIELEILRNSCSHLEYHQEGSLGIFCNRCGAPLE